MSNVKKSNFTKEIIFEENKKFSSQRVSRIYHTNKKLLSNKAVMNIYAKLNGLLGPDEKLMIRAMTEYGPRTIKGFDEDELQFQTTEKYLEGTSNPEAKPYRKIDYVDVYVVKNKLKKNI